MLRTAILWIRTALVSIPAIILLTVFATTAALVIAIVNPRGRSLEAIRRYWARVLLVCAFVKVKFEGSARLPLTGACIICANHLSYMDPPAIVAAMPMALRFVAKESLFGVPFLGWGMRVAGDVALDRDNPRAAARSLARAATLARQGHSLMIFPEGGRSPDGEVQPFLSGAFRLAIQAQVPVVPMAIRGTREALQPRSLLMRGGTVRVLLGDPIPTAGMTKKDQEPLRLRVEQAIREML